MARKPSDDIRDAKRLLKIKNQQIPELQYDTKGESKAWRADPTVKKTKDYKSNKDGFRIDWEEKHHLQGLNLYDSYTDGMSPEQIKIVDERLAKQGMFKGNVGPNRIDLPRRFHESSKFEQYEGAHQQTKREGIDSRAELDRLRSLSPEERLNELDDFIEKQGRHRKVAQQKFMQQHMLEPGNNSKTNPFGGNFSQQVLQDRNPAATLKAGQALKAERAALRVPKKTPGISKALNVPVLAGLMAAGGTLLAGGGAQAAAREFVDAENPLNNLDSGALFDDSTTYSQALKIRAAQNAKPLLERLKAGAFGGLFPSSIKGSRSRFD